MPSDPENLVLTFTPPLVATCIALDPSVADAMAAARGYADIDPEHCWAEWQQVRDGHS